MRYAVIFAILVWSCKTKHQLAISDFEPDFSTGPPTMVYKTKGDYAGLVPVFLSEDKTRIVGYPGLSDLHAKKEFPFPTPLQDGYLLDNRGIGRDVAFLKLTYEAYRTLETLPTVKEMYTWIQDKDPLIALCDCGSRKAFTDVEAQLNALIRANQLERVCRVLK